MDTFMGQSRTQKTTRVGLTARLRQPVVSQCNNSEKNSTTVAGNMRGYEG
jgi:hypothetical protein